MTRLNIPPSVRLTLLGVMLSCIFSGCGTINKADARASTANAIKDEVSVCELVDARQMEEVTASQLVNFVYDHTPTFDNEPPSEEDLFPTLHCRIYFPDDTAFSKIEIHYQGRTVVDFGESVGTVAFDQALLHEGVKETTIEQKEGRGLIYEDNSSGPLFAWKYPDGHVLTMRVSYAVRDDEGNRDLRKNIQMLISIFQLVGDRVPQVASGPKRELTFYPEDSDPLRDTKSP